MRYPLVEAMTGALLGLIAYQFGYTFTTIFAWAFTLALIALTFIDFDTQLLPDDITLPLLWLGLLFNLDGGFTDLQSAVIGAATGYLILWSIYWLFKIVTKKEGMGYGDFKLLAKSQLPGGGIITGTCAYWITKSTAWAGVIVATVHDPELIIHYGEIHAAIETASAAALYLGTLAPTP
jgi:hypothetical protein